MRFLLFILLMPSLAFGQSFEIGYSPTSVHPTGDAVYAEKASLLLEFWERGNNFISFTPNVRFTHVALRQESHDKFGAPVNGSYSGVFSLPLNLHTDFKDWNLVSRYGIGFFDRKFPSRNGMTWNFVLEGGVQKIITEDLTAALKLSHISNGNRGRINTGLNNFTLFLSYHL